MVTFIPGWRHRLMVVICLTCMPVRLLSMACLSGLFFLSVPVFAQTNEAEAGSNNQDVSQVEQFADWTYRCYPSAEEAKQERCEILYVANITFKEKTLNVLTLALAPVAEETEGIKAYKLTALTPLNVLLSQGLTITVKGVETPYQFPFYSCDPTGCWVQISIEQDLIDAFKRALSTKVSYFLSNEQKVNVSLSLSGFTKSFTRLSQ